MKRNFCLWLAGLSLAATGCELPVEELKSLPEKPVAHETTVTVRHFAGTQEVKSDTVVIFSSRYFRLGITNDTLWADQVTYKLQGNTHEGVLPDAILPVSPTSLQDGDYPLNYTIFYLLRDSSLGSVYNLSRRTFSKTIILRVMNRMDNYQPVFYSPVFDTGAVRISWSYYKSPNFFKYEFFNSANQLKTITSQTDTTYSDPNYFGKFSYRLVVTAGATSLIKTVTVRDTASIHLTAASQNPDKSITLAWTRYRQYTNLNSVVVEYSTDGIKWTDYSTLSVAARSATFAPAGTNARYRVSYRKQFWDGPETMAVTGASPVFTN